MIEAAKGSRLDLSSLFIMTVAMMGIWVVGMDMDVIGPEEITNLAGSVAEVITGRKMKSPGQVSSPCECAFRGLMSSPGPLGRAFPSVSSGHKEFGNKPRAGQ